MEAYLKAVATFFNHVLLMWMTPSFPWLVCLLLLGLAGATIAPTRREEGLWPAGVWLVAAVSIVVVFVVQPRILLLGSERTMMFAVVLLAIAALSVGGDSRDLAERSDQGHAGRRDWAVDVAVTILLLVALADVLVGLRVSRVISSQVAARERLVAEQVRAGRTDVVVPPLGSTGSRVVLYWDIQRDPEYYINVAVATIYGVRTIRLGDPPRP